jgi:hypothetical protein
MLLERTRPFRLVERGGPGPSCDAEGIGLGAITLVSLEPSDGAGFRYSVRPIDELGDILDTAYGRQEEHVIQCCHRGLKRAASALQKGDLALAGIEAVMLRLPELGADAMTKLAVLADLEKGGDSWQNEPRIPAGQSGGGQWTTGSGVCGPLPGQGSAHPVAHLDTPAKPPPKTPPRNLTSTLVDLSNETAGRLVDAANWLLEPVAHIPIAPEIAAGEPDFPMGAAWVEATDPDAMRETRPVSRLEVGLNVLSILGALTPEARAALEAGEVRRFSTFYQLKQFLGSPGPGNEWHHIVEQYPANLKRFGAQAIQSTDNVVAVPKSLHRGLGTISAYYSGKTEFTGGLTVRDWLAPQSFEAHRAFGIKVLKRYNLWK